MVQPLTPAADAADGGAGTNAPDGTEAAATAAAGLAPDPAQRVGYAGEPGAFAEDAVLAFFAHPFPVPLPSFGAVFGAIASGDVPAGVVPVESSLLGTIRENLDLLYASDLRIVGEVTVSVRLALLALPGERFETITRVYSISAALAQADAFLASRPWTVETTYNTAGAARLVTERREPGTAAIAAARVAEIYGLEVVRDGIQSGDHNRTRFAVVAQAPLVDGLARRAAVAGPPKTTLVFAVRNLPGSLHRSLGAFASRGLNLSRLESRPWTERGSRWEYLFWADLDADAAEPAAAAALADLARDTELVRILGSYPRAVEE